MPKPCLNTANAYLHKFRVLESEDDVAVFISIAVLKLHMAAAVFSLLSTKTAALVMP